ncbi:MAG: PAS domain S-box protein [Nitrospirota bacterium]|nr:PAS domain S-box protein [Nitrospirota bacterium]
MKNLFRSLYTKTLLGSLAVLVVLAVIFTVFFVRKEMQLLENALVERGNIMASSTADHGALDLLVKDKDAMQENARILLSNPDVLRVLFFDNEENLLAGEGQPHTGPMTPPGTEPPSGIADYRVVSSGGTKTYLFYRKVSYAVPQTGEELFTETVSGDLVAIGWVRVDLSDKTIRMERQQLIENSIALSLAVTLLLSGVLYWLLLKQVGQPLRDVREVVRAAEEISKGNMSKKINVRFSHEIGMLADTFNRMTEAIREREEDLLKLATAVESTDEAMVIADMAGTVVYANPAFEKITGYDHVAVKGLPVARFFSADESSGEHKTMMEAMCTGDTCTLEIANRRKDGSTFLADQSVFPITTKEGERLYTLLVIRDITEKDRLEKNLIQAQKMEAIGTLAGGVAHDFNNLLAGIMGYASLLRLQFDKEGIRSTEYLDTIDELSKRAARTTSHLLGFARRGRYRNEQVDLTQLVSEIADFLRQTLDRRISVDTVLTNNMIVVQADSNQVHQAILNICLNSRDAMPNGGVLMISTDTVSVNKENMLRMGTQARPGSYARVTVSDNGAGMDGEVKSRIFEPFFTTKEVGKGTGLGLAMVYGIVSNHGGFVEVASEPGKGTILSIYLPLKTSENSTTGKGNA